MGTGDENLDKHYQDCPGCLCDLRGELQAERELADELAKSLWAIVNTPSNLNECIELAKTSLDLYNDSRKIGRGDD